MSTVLIVDDMAIFRDPIAASLRLAGYEAVAAPNGQEALALIAKKRPDLILLDLAMPVMDGMTMLAALRRMPGGEKIPVILLTAAAEKRLVLQAAQHGVGDYLLKSRFSLAELLTRVKKHLESKPEQTPAEATAPNPMDAAPATDTSARTEAVTAVQSPIEIPRLLTREECLKRAEAAMDVRSLSGVAAQVISLAASPRGDLEELASLIGRDPALSARVLHAANSAAYTSNRGPVTNVSDAVRKVGCATIRGIASTVGIYEAMSASADPDFNPIRSWQHSFAVATLCEQLCLSARPELGGTAHIVGLCHDLGEILFRTHFAHEYRQVLEVRQRCGRPLAYVERQMLGMPHGELVRTIIRKMGLPQMIREAIEAFHAGDSDASTDPLVRILRMAEAYANGVGLASSKLSPVRPLTRNECRAATGLENPTFPEGEEFRAQIYALTSLLGRLSQPQERELMVPLHARTSARLWLAREAGFSSFDPIAAALQLLAGDVTIKDRLPLSAAECDDHAALAIVTRTPAVKGLLGTDIQRAASYGTRRIPALWLCARPEGAPQTPLAPIAAEITLDGIAEFLSRTESAIAA